VAGHNKIGCSYMATCQCRYLTLPRLHMQLISYSHHVT